MNHEPDPADDAFARSVIAAIVVFLCLGIIIAAVVVAGALPLP